MEKIHSIYPNSILIITAQNNLERLFTPFWVICVVAVEPFNLKDKVEVQEVFTSQEKPFIYRIQGKYYAYFYFRIV